MKIGDLVMLQPFHESRCAEFGVDMGLVLDQSVRGPTPGAVILWPMSNKTEWIKLEDLKCVNLKQLPAERARKL